MLSSSFSRAGFRSSRRRPEPRRVALGAKNPVIYLFMFSCFRSSRGASLFLILSLASITGGSLAGCATGRPIRAPAAEPVHQAHPSEPILVQLTNDERRRHGLGKPLEVDP